MWGLLQVDGQIFWCWQQFFCGVQVVWYVDVGVYCQVQFGLYCCLNVVQVVVDEYYLSGDFCGIEIGNGVGVYQVWVVEYYQWQWFVGDQQSVNIQVRMCNLCQWVEVQFGILIFGLLQQCQIQCFFCQCLVQWFIVIYSGDYLYLWMMLFKLFEDFWYQ